ncbi:MAG: hypothetical protein PHP62_00115 [Candidatus Moranbacteria bacterium]|nr:hypothetical protein [Candidatus Moranbacteria bacterium]
MKINFFRHLSQKTLSYITGERLMFALQDSEEHGDFKLAGTEVLDSLINNEIDLPFSFLANHSGVEFGFFGDVFKDAESGRGYIMALVSHYNEKSDEWCLISGKKYLDQNFVYVYPVTLEK